MKSFLFGFNFSAYYKNSLFCQTYDSLFLRITFAVLLVKWFSYDKNIHTHTHMFVAFGTTLSTKVVFFNVNFGNFKIKRRRGRSSGNRYMIQNAQKRQRKLKNFDTMTFELVIIINI